MMKKLKASSQTGIKEASATGRKAYTRHHTDCKSKPDMCARLLATKDCDLQYKDTDVNKACKEGVYDQNVIETQTAPQERQLVPKKLKL